MQMASKLEETKSQAAIINQTKRRLRGEEREFSAGDGELRRGRGGERARNNKKKPNTRCGSRPRKPVLQPAGGTKGRSAEGGSAEGRGGGGHLTLALGPEAGCGERSARRGAQDPPSRSPRPGPRCSARTVPAVLPLWRKKRRLGNGDGYFAREIILPRQQPPHGRLEQCKD